MQLISCHDGKLLTQSADHTSVQIRKGFSTGLTALDSLLPGGVFARGAVHEVLSERGNGEPLFFAMLLARAVMHETTDNSHETAGCAHSPSPGTPGEGWGGGCVERASTARTPSLTLPRNTGGGDKSAPSTLGCRVGVLAHHDGRMVGEYTHPTLAAMHEMAGDTHEKWSSAHSLSPVLRGEGRGEGTDASTCEPRHIATYCPLTLPSPLSTGERVLSHPGTSSDSLPIICCDPAGTIYPPALAAMGISPRQLYLLRPADAADLMWAVAECLRCKAVGAVIASPKRLSRTEARKLQLSAERGGGIGLLLRTFGQSPHYAAATRWLVGPMPGERTVQRWNIQLIHAPGGRAGQSICLELCRRTGEVSASEIKPAREGDVRAVRAS